MLAAFKAEANVCHEISRTVPFPRPPLHRTWNTVRYLIRYLGLPNFVTTGTAHILKGLGIESDLAPSAIGVFKIGVGVYNRNSSSIGSTTHANSTQQQNQQREQQTPKRISSKSGR